MTTLKKRSDATAIVASLKETFDAGITAQKSWRVSQLTALKAMVADNAELFEKALAADLGKSSTEAQLTEIGIILGDADYALKHLDSWLKPKKVPVPIAVMPARASIVSEPLGVVLIIAPWNYPMQLLLAPLIGAIAAGNAAVVKPSEMSGETSKLLASLIPVYLDTRAISVVEGAAEETGWLLEQTYDHIFYTGNGRVARIVAEAAAKNLTPTTLELGGKSPVYLDSTADMKVASERIAWAKFINAGQTCVAPDYILGTPEILASFEQHVHAAIEKFFGKDPETSPDYGRIINKRQFDRLKALRDSGTVGAVGKPVSTTKYFPPTLLTDVARDSAVMEEEIFGPILPLIPVSGVEDAIEFIRSKPKPLALYVYSDDAKVRKAFTERTSSGSLVYNVSVAQLSVPDLPFGGVGESGMGAYRGKRSFDTFSHEKSMLSKPLKPETLSIVFPPYTDSKKKLIKGLLRKLS